MDKKQKLIGDANRPRPAWPYAFPALLHRPGGRVGGGRRDGKTRALFERKERSLEFAGADAALSIAVRYLDWAGVTIVRLRVRGQRNVMSGSVSIDPAQHHPIIRRRIIHVDRRRRQHAAQPVGHVSRRLPLKKLVGEIEECGAGDVVADHGSRHRYRGAYRCRGDVEERPHVSAVRNCEPDGPVDGVLWSNWNIGHVQLIAGNIHADGSERRYGRTEVPVAVGEGNAGITKTGACVWRDIAGRP